MPEGQEWDNYNEEMVTDRNIIWLELGPWVEGCKYSVTTCQGGCWGNQQPAAFSVYPLVLGQGLSQLQQLKVKGPKMIVMTVNQPPGPRAGWRSIGTGEGQMKMGGMLTKSGRIFKGRRSIKAK